MTTLKPAGDYTRDEMIELLQNGAAANGTNTAHAAVYLLTFTELPGTRAFADLVEVEMATVSRIDEATDSVVRETLPAAWVQDWNALADSDATTRAGSGATKLIQLAASLAARQPVDLNAVLPGLGTAHLKRAAEAVLIAGGGHEFYTVTGTAKLDALNAERAAFSA